MGHRLGLFTEGARAFGGVHTRPRASAAGPLEAERVAPCKHGLTSRYSMSPVWLYRGSQATAARSLFHNEHVNPSPLRDQSATDQKKGPPVIALLRSSITGVTEGEGF